MKSRCLQIFILFHIPFALLHLNIISCIIPRANGPPEKYCGPNLSNMLEDLCIEYLPMGSKRSNSIGKSYRLTKHDNDSPFLNERYALSSLFHRTRRDPMTVSAYDECCEKGCRIGELLQYCKIPKYTVVE